jgi:hypothetical protein
MKHITMILLAWMSIFNQAGQDLYVCRNAKISLFYMAPIEDIAAASNSCVSVFNAITSDLAFRVNMASFR